MLTDDIKLLKQWIETSQSIVFFGGAGVSTASSIPDFRGKNGITHHQNIPVEVLLSHDYFVSHPKDFFEFYQQKMIHSEALPNVIHRYLADHEQKYKNLTVITQNIDGLHQKAGSKQVMELHGTIELNTCINCKKTYHLSELDFSRTIPRCQCQGIIKPHVVLYGEMLNQETLTASIKAIEKADLLLVCGTSLVVYPAAGLIEHYHGNKLVIINQTNTNYDSKANLVIHTNLEEVFTRLRNEER